MPGAMQPLSEARKATFLKVLAKCGIMVWAARAASPNATGERGSISSFRTLMLKDPAFAAQVAEARAEADAGIERECFRRAIEGVRQPVFQKGEQAVDSEGKPAFITNYSDRLLERLLESRMPEKWSQQKYHKHSGTIHHQPTGIMELGTADLAALSKEQRRQLQGLLGIIRANRAGDVPAIEHHPSTVIEGQAVEVEAEPVEVKPYKRKPFDQADHLAAYREFAEGDTLAGIEAIEAKRNGGEK